MGAGSSPLPIYGFSGNEILLIYQVEMQSSKMTDVPSKRHPTVEVNNDNYPESGGGQRLSTRQSVCEVDRE